MWGPAPCTYSCNYFYYVTFVNACTRFSYICLLKSTFETLSKFKEFHTMIWTQFSLPIKAFQSDWGGKFRSLTHYLTGNGIQHHIICLHTRHQKRVVKRKHKHIVELGLTLMTEAQLPIKLWNHAFITSAYIINRQPIIVIDHEVPYQKLFNKTPDYRCLPVFRCSCFPLIKPYNKHNLDFVQKNVYFLDTPPLTKAISVQI